MSFADKQIQNTIYILKTSLQAGIFFRRSFCCWEINLSKDEMGRHRSQRHKKTTQEVVGSTGAGCYDAASLSILGLLGATPGEAAVCLDKCIDPILDIFNKDRPLQNYDRDRVGKEGQHWHMATIRMAVRRSGSSRYLKKQLVLKGGCKALLSGGAFLIDGHLNGHDDEKVSTRRRSIAVKDGLMFCPGLDTMGVPVSNLCLDENGKPDQDRGYMARFLKVYKVQGGNTNT
jgi:hypothetical protein